MSAPGRGLGSLSASDRALVAVAVALGAFMQVLDTTVANVAIPSIAGNLGVSADQGTWVITSFAIANAISVPLTGWLMARFGLVRTFVAAIGLFTAASFLCGIAWDLPSLVGFRVVQGLVSGPMAPGSQAVLLAIFPPERRAKALAVWSITTLVAPVVGPVLGGWITDNWSWPWIFFINIPAGIFSVLVCLRVLQGRDTPTRQLPVDRVGLGLLVVWVGSLQLMLDKGKDADWFASPFIVALAVVAVLGFVAFLIWELTEEHPIVDLTLFKLRDFRVGTFVNSVGYAVFFGNLILLTLWLQTQMGYNATWGGMVSVPAGLIGVILGPVVAKLLARVDARWVATFSMVFFGLSFTARSQLTTDANFGAVAFAVGLQGFSLATFFIASVTMMLNRIPPERVPSASGMASFLRFTAGGVAASLVTTVWDHRAALYQARLIERASPYDAPFRDAVNGLHAAGLSGDQPIAVVMRSLVAEAYGKSAFEIAAISAFIMFALIAVVWMGRSTKGGSHKPHVAAAD
jgi:MFS transporter, DHA2 family, multidrug resistance protein